MNTSQNKQGVFISYSHKDSKSVSRIVKFISVGRKDLVFQDTNDLIPGKKFEPQLMRAIDEADMVMVFWCSHSSKSEEVETEYRRAMEAKKDIVPVLLDDCELTNGLEDYQWLDMRGVIAHDESVLTRLSKYKNWLIAGVVILIAFVAITFFWSKSSAPSSPNLSDQPRKSMKQVKELKYARDSVNSLFDFKKSKAYPSKKELRKEIDSISNLMANPTKHNTLKIPEKSRKLQMARDSLESLSRAVEKGSFNPNRESLKELENLQWMSDSFQRMITSSENSDLEYGSTGAESLEAGKHDESENNFIAWLTSKMPIVLLVIFPVIFLFFWYKRKQLKKSTTVAGTAILEKINEKLPAS